MKIDICVLIRLAGQLSGRCYIGVFDLMYNMGVGKVLMNYYSKIRQICSSLRHWYNVISFSSKLYFLLIFGQETQESLPFWLLQDQASRNGFSCDTKMTLKIGVKMVSLFPLDDGDWQEATTTEDKDTETTNNQQTGVRYFLFILLPSSIH